MDTVVEKSRGISARIKESIKDQPVSPLNWFSRITLEGLHALRRRYKSDFGPPSQELKNLNKKYNIKDTIPNQILQIFKRHKERKNRLNQHQAIMEVTDHLSFFAGKREVEEAIAYLIFRSLEKGSWYAVNPVKLLDTIFPYQRRIDQILNIQTIDLGGGPEQDPFPENNDLLAGLFKKDLLKQVIDEEGLYWWTPTETLIRQLRLHFGTGNQGQTAMITQR